jgi:hypothetical protein
MVENLKALIVHWLLRELAIHLNEPIQSYPVQYGGDRLWQNFFNPINNGIIGKLGLKPRPSGRL